MALHLKSPSRFVAYYRVSTARQGRSGLGLEAQREAVHAFMGGSTGDLAEAFIEIESGGRDDDPPGMEHVLGGSRGGGEAAR
jgi:DNA invertase Pin-like site-specific DNA recombinase